MIPLLNAQISQLQRALDLLSDRVDEFSFIEPVAGAEASAKLGAMLSVVQRLKSRAISGVRKPSPPSPLAPVSDGASLPVPSAN